MGFFVKSNESLSGKKNFFEFLLITVSRVHEDGRQFDSSNGFKNDNRDEIFCEIEIRFTILHFKF